MTTDLPIVSLDAETRKRNGRHRVSDLLLVLGVAAFVLGVMLVSQGVLPSQYRGSLGSAPVRRTGLSRAKGARTGCAPGHYDVSGRPDPGHAASCHQQCNRGCRSLSPASRLGPRPAAGTRGHGSAAATYFACDLSRCPPRHAGNPGERSCAGSCQGSGRSWRGNATRSWAIARSWLLTGEVQFRVVGRFRPVRTMSLSV